MRHRWLIGVVLIMAAQPVCARPGVKTETRLFVERVETDINGRPRRVLAGARRPEPGDQLITVIDWRNDSGSSLDGFTLTRPLPSGARFDAAADGMTVSVDGGASWGRISDLWLPTPLGGVRRATAEDVTHVRWRSGGSIAPGAEGRVSYRLTWR